MEKKAFWCLAIDTTKDSERVVQDATIALAIDEKDARQAFLLENAENLKDVLPNLEVIVSPFCCTCR